jgi:hypothetical protein
VASYLEQKLTTKDGMDKDRVIGKIFNRKLKENTHHEDRNHSGSMSGKTSQTRKTEVNGGSLVAGQPT